MEQFIDIIYGGKTVFLCDVYLNESVYCVTRITTLSRVHFHVASFQVMSSFVLFMLAKHNKKRNSIFVLTSSKLTYINEHNSIFFTADAVLFRPKSVCKQMYNHGMISLSSRLYTLRKNTGKFFLIKKITWTVAWPICSCLRNKQSQGKIDEYVFLPFWNNITVIREACYGGTWQAK